MPLVLDEKDFEIVIGLTPLVSIDLVVYCNGDVLLGRRLNRPARDYWFVPGGRILKGESLMSAYSRLTKAELGVSLDYVRSSLLGVYEHFYDDSVFGATSSTHYISLGMRLELADAITDFPDAQHGSWRWWNVHDALTATDVHGYTKDYLRSLLSGEDSR